MITSFTSVQSFPAYKAADFCVAEGVALGDAITFADDLLLDDCYALSPLATQHALGLSQDAETSNLRILSGAGQLSFDVHLDCAVTFMDGAGRSVEGLVFVKLVDGFVAECFLLPMGTMERNQHYRLVNVDQDSAQMKLAELVTGSMTADTEMMLADGTNRAVRDLRIGDMVRTRDNGAQPLRWIGQTTARAQGHLAPVVIRAGAMGNDRALRVSPNQLVMVQREGRTVGVPASQLVNDVDIVQAGSGQQDYFQLLFDAPEVVFAEGVATPSMVVTGLNKCRIPELVARRLRIGQAPAVAAANANAQQPGVLA